MLTVSIYTDNNEISISCAFDGVTCVYGLKELLLHNFGLVNFQNGVWLMVRKRVRAELKCLMGADGAVCAPLVSRPKMQI